MEDELKWEWDISKVSVILRGFGTFSLSFHVSELMRNSEIEFVQSKCTDLVTLVHLEWPFGRSRARKWQCEGYFTIYPEHPNTDAQARNMVVPMPPTQHRQRNNILQELAKNRGWASSLTCALLSAQKGPEEGREGGREQSLQGTGAPCSTQCWSGLSCGCLWAGEQVEIWEALDLQSRAWAALWAPTLANATAWRAFQLSGSSWSSLFSSERLSWMLLCASHPSGCSQQPPSQEEMDLPRLEFVFSLICHGWGSPFMGIWHCLTWPCICPAANPAFLSLGTLSFSLRNSDFAGEGDSVCLSLSLLIFISISSF